MLGDARAQRGAEAALQRLADFLEMRQRQPDFLAAGDDDAVWDRAAEIPPASRSAWQRDPASCARRARRRRDRPARTARGLPASAAARFRWQVPASARSADRADRGNLSDASRRRPWRRARRLRGTLVSISRCKDRRQRRTLRDQFGLGLLDQLVLVDLEKIQTEQRQREHAGQHQKNHKAEAGRHFCRGADAGPESSLNARPRSVPI